MKMRYDMRMSGDTTGMSVQPLPKATEILRRPLQDSEEVHRRLSKLTVWHFTMVRMLQSLFRTNRLEEGAVLRARCFTALSEQKGQRGSELAILQHHHALTTSLETFHLTLASPPKQNARDNYHAETTYHDICRVVCLQEVPVRSLRKWAYVQSFCQPQGWALSTERQEPRFFVSVLTDIDANRHYCACMCFNETIAITPSKPVDEEEEPADGEGAGHHCGSLARSIATITHHSIMYAPKCLVLVSRLDYLETFRAHRSPLHHDQSLQAAQTSGKVERLREARSRIADRRILIPPRAGGCHASPAPRAGSQQASTI
ncbi:hypothetical protein PR048_031898 [Dryococelus australis]|uniref:uDENN domain-containing protein n=1 Tax=Dryococelus australis TaxID=614101 RepID=A0ABQ9G6L5_9NEOP|nr:hypothetical protein PR048_031898 [Dryococelus australis]